MSTIYFIDSRVQNSQAWIATLPAGATWYLLEPDEDGLVQMAADLVGVTGLESIHILAHGDVGTLYLGNAVLNASNILDYEGVLQAIGSNLSETGDILLYGNRVGAGELGQQFIVQLSNITGADIAASTDNTGTGGDWILEASSGTVEAASLSGLATLGALGAITGTDEDDTLTGDAGNDTLLGGLGNDTIDGGAGYNTYRIQGTIDTFYWSFNANGQMIITDTITDGVDVNDGSDQGVDTLKNIQRLEFVNADGTVNTSFQVDDYSNAVDDGNTKIQYGVWVTGRANYYGDTDWFKLNTVAGQKIVLAGAQGSTSGYLADSTNGWSILGQSSYLSSGNESALTWNATGTVDVNFRSDAIPSTSPGASKGYGFILRRELDGTDAGDLLVAGTDYEHLVGGLGNDTLTGSDRSDKLLGGAGNDLMAGGQGNDEIDGGAGTANVAVFSGNKADYTGTWLGGNLSLRVADQVAGRDGIDTLTNVQILRFADGDVVLDAEANTPTQTISLFGQNLQGSLPVGSPQVDWLDTDYFRLKFGADISANTALRITAQAAATGSNYSGQLYFQFYAQDAQDVLTFNRLDTSGTINQFQVSLSPGSSQSWIVSPQYWGSNSEFQSMVQWADVQVWGYAYSPDDANIESIASNSIDTFTVKVSDGTQFSSQALTVHLINIPVTTAKYFVLAGSGANYIDYQLDAGDINLQGQYTIQVGTSGVDAIHVRPDSAVDFTLSGASADKIYLDGNYAEYVFNLSGSLMTMVRSSGNSDELVRFTRGTNLTSSDLLIFADGSVSSWDLFNFLKNGVELPALGSETSLNPLTPALPGSPLSARVKAFSLDSTGETFTPVGPGMNLITVGGIGVDRVYVGEGSSVDAALLGASTDLVYFPGSWSDYTKILSGSLITFSRQIDGAIETVKVVGSTGALNDKLIFSDGAVMSNNAKQALQVDANTAIHAITTYDALTTTPLNENTSVFSV